MQMPVPSLKPGVFQEFPQGAVLAMRALEDMGSLPEFVTGRVWSCAKWATSKAVARPYAGVEELRSFARACDARAQWTVYGIAVLSFTCLLRVGEAAPIRRGAPAEGAWGFTPSSVTNTSSEGSRGATVGHGCDGSTMRDPNQRSRWRTSAQKGRPTTVWSWQPPSADVTAPTPGGMRGGEVGRRPYGGCICRSDGSPGGVVGCESWWRPTMVTPETISSWQTTWSCRGPVREGTWSGGLYPSKMCSWGSFWPYVCAKRMWSRRRPRGVEGCGGHRRVPGRPRSTRRRGGGGQGDGQLARGGGTERIRESPDRSGDTRVPHFSLAFAAVQA